MLKTITHEDYIKSIRDLILPRLNKEEQEKLMSTKLTYGAGYGARGVTFFKRWNNGKDGLDIAQVCADGEENMVQIAGTTLHELAHVLAGINAGHGNDWKVQARRIGLRKAMQAGQNYCLAYFDPDFRFKLAQLPMPTDGKPEFRSNMSGLPIFKVRGCSIGIGLRGGKSRGIGSGSRLRLYSCECGIKVRVASDEFRAHCDRCDSAFKREVKA